jgi:hypothetical protein
MKRSTHLGDETHRFVALIGTCLRLRVDAWAGA